MENDNNDCICSGFCGLSMDSKENPQFYTDLNEEDEEIMEYFIEIHNKLLNNRINDRKTWKV